MSSAPKFTFPSSSPVRSVRRVAFEYPTPVSKSPNKAWKSENFTYFFFIYKTNMALAEWQEKGLKHEYVHQW